MTTTCSCPSFEPSRRKFLTGLVAGAGGLAMTSVFGGAFRQVTYGAAGGNVLVVLSLRGGSDGLSMVVPHADPAYAAARPGIAVRSDQVIAADATFGLHPEFKPLLPMWEAGTFAAVHAVGLPAPNRSHFEAMEVVEDADPGTSARVGWINRMVGLDLSAGAGDAMQLGSSSPPTSLAGPASTLALPTLSDLRLPKYGADERPQRVALSTTWKHAKGPLGVGVRSALRTTRTLKSLTSAEIEPQHGASYPDGPLKGVLLNTAALIRAEVGTKVVTIDYGDWDMHTDVGNTGQGRMKNHVSHLAGSLAAFFTDLGGAASKVTVVTMSEFGRRVAQNGDNGLDHGYGNCMLLLGGGVKGGRYYAPDWKGLGRTSLVDGDVAVTRDYRTVLTEVLRSRYTDVNASKVFPRLRHERRIGVMA